MPTGLDQPPSTPSPEAPTKPASHGKLRALLFGVDKRSRKRRAASVALLSGVVAVLVSDAAPTGLSVVDAIYRGLFCAGLAYLGSRARRPALILGTVVAAVFGGPALLVFRITAFVAAGFLVMTNTRSRVLGAVIGGCVGVAVLDLSIAFGGPAGELACGILAVGPIAVSGFRRFSPENRTRMIRTLWIFLAIAAIGLAAAAVQSARALTPVRSAISSADAGVELARSGRGETAGPLFADATANFDRAAGLLGSPIVWVGRAVPFAGINISTAQETLSLGAELGESSERIAAEVDLETLQSRDGGIDLEQLASFEKPVLAAQEVLERLDSFLESTDSPWLISPVTTRLDQLDSQVEELRSQNEVAALGLEHGPAILGGEEKRNYLFLLGNPAESRDIGGHLGNWAELSFVDGKPKLEAVGSAIDLFLSDEDQIAAREAGVEDRYPATLVEMKPVQYPQNWGAHPDFDEVAALSTELYERSTGRKVDGAIYADPFVFSALLELTGPISVDNPMQNVALDSANATDFLLREQYSSFADEAQASEALEASIDALFTKLVSLPLPPPARMSDLFWPLVQEGRLRINTEAPGDDPLLARLNLLGDVPDVAGGDVLGITTRNVGPSKIDSFLTRETTAQIDWDPQSGGVESNIAVKLSNDAPADGFNDIVLGNTAGLPTGTNLSDVSILTPFRLSAVLVDGVEVGARPVLEGDIWRHTVRVAIPPGETRIAQFYIQGSVGPGTDYPISVLPQPTATESTLSVELVPRGVAEPDRARLSVSHGAVRETVYGDEAEGISWSTR